MSWWQRLLTRVHVTDGNEGELLYVIVVYARRWHRRQWWWSVQARSLRETTWSLNGRMFTLGPCDFGAYGGPHPSAVDAEAAALAYVLRHRPTERAEEDWARRAWENWQNWQNWQNWDD